MKKYIEDRVNAEAQYILNFGGTIRSVAKKFLVSKSTVHIDLSKRLEKIDIQKFFKVKRILDLNFDNRHLRGGEATRKKYLSLKVDKQK